MALPKSKSARVVQAVVAIPVVAFILVVQPVSLRMTDSERGEGVKGVKANPALSLSGFSPSPELSNDFFMSH